MVHDAAVTVHLRHLIDYLLCHGDTVNVITLRAWRDDLAPWEARGVRFHGPNRGELVAAFLRLCLHPRRLSRLVFVAAQSSRAIGFRGFARVLGDCTLLHAVCENQKPDVLLAYHTLPEGLIGALIKQEHQIPLIITVFGELHMYSDDRYLNLAHWVLDSSDLILATSQRCANGVANAGISPSEVRVIYYGVNLERFHPNVDGSSIRERYGLGRAPVVLYTGRLSNTRGVDVLVEAVPHILEHVSDVQVLITGEPNKYQERLAHRVNELGITEYVTFTGFVSEHELIALYAACTVLAYPQSIPYGCMGLSMIEAMACGKPVVGARIAGVPEAIIDGETGLLVEPRNPKALADAIVKILLDPQLASRLGQNGRKRAEEEFDYRDSVRRIGAVINQLVS